MLERFQSITPKDLHIFFTQFSVLIESGIPLLDCISAIQSQNKRLERILVDLHTSVKSGLNLGEALLRHKNVFGEFSCVIVGIGQKSGNLAVVLNTLSIYFQKRAQNASKTKQALMYPFMLFVSMIFAFFAIIWFVIPPFVMLFEELGVSLPIYTRLMLWVYDFFSVFGVVFGVALCGGIAILSALYKSNENIRFAFDSIFLRVVFFGKLHKLRESQGFCFSLFCCLQGAMPLDEALNLSSDIVQNTALKARFKEVLERIKSGQSLSQAIVALDLLDGINIALISAGEKSAKLSVMLKKVYENLQEQINEQTDYALKMLEPLLSILMGGLIVLLALGVFVPMWDMSANVF
ncbi:type II secretion system F family protein [Helicobacter sp. 23-1048]